MEQFSILPLGTFPAAGEDQHRGVQAGGIGTGPALGNNDLDEEDFASRRHGCSAVGQDSGRRFVVPVVHDPLQQVGVPAGWHGFTRAPLFVNGRSQQKRVISGRLTMQMTRYNRARKMRRSSHASPAATGTRLAQPTPWSVHPAVGARRLRWHDDYLRTALIRTSGSNGGQNHRRRRQGCRREQRPAPDTQQVSGCPAEPKYQETHPDQSADTQQSLAMLYGPGRPRPRAATSPRPDHRAKGVA